MCVYSSEYIHTILSLTIIHRSLSSDQKIYFQIFEGRIYINHCIELTHKGGTRRRHPLYPFDTDTHREHDCPKSIGKNVCAQCPRNRFCSIGPISTPSVGRVKNGKCHFHYFWRISLIFATYSEIIDQTVEHAVERHVAFCV